MSMKRLSLVVLACCCIVGFTPHAGAVTIQPQNGTFFYNFVDGNVLAKLVLTKSVADPLTDIFSLSFTARGSSTLFGISLPLFIPTNSIETSLSPDVFLVPELSPQAESKSLTAGFQFGSFEFSTNGGEFDASGGGRDFRFTFDEGNEKDGTFGSDEIFVLSGSAQTSSLKGNWLFAGSGDQIPEPSTWLLFAIGILSIIGMSWRQRKKAAA